MSFYSWIFRRKYVQSTELRQNPMLVAHLLADGYLWVRIVHRPWVQALRNPTVGRLLEISAGPDVGSVRLDSGAGRRMYRTLCSVS